MTTGLERACDECGDNSGGVWLGPDDSALCDGCVAQVFRAALEDIAGRRCLRNAYPPGCMGDCPAHHARKALGLPPGGPEPSPQPAAGCCDRPALVRMWGLTWCGKCGQSAIPTDGA